MSCAFAIKKQNSFWRSFGEINKRISNGMNKGAEERNSRNWINLETSFHKLFGFLTPLPEDKILKEIGTI